MQDKRLQDCSNPESVKQSDSVRKAIGLSPEPFRTGGFPPPNFSP